MLKKQNFYVLLIIKKDEKVYYKVLKQNSITNFVFILNNDFEKNKLLLEKIEDANVIEEFYEDIFENKKENNYNNKVSQNKILLTNVDDIKEYFILDFDSKIILTSILNNNLEKVFNFFKNFEVLRVY